MDLQSPYEIPDQAPAEALAELDAAARTLDDLSSHGARLTVDMDEQTRSLRIELDRGSGATSLTPTQLFALLDGS